jgi:3-oxoacyl-[acyl-carrier protein] reductase
MVNYELKDKVVLITGTNNPEGIGAATAYAFAKEGAKLVLVYKKIDRKYNEEKTDEFGVDRYYKANAQDATILENKLKEINADYIILEKDISKEEDVKEIYNTAINKYEKVDILVNNAATDDENGFDTIEKITQEVIDDTFSVNVRGTLLMTREFVNNRAGYGRIINLSISEIDCLLIDLLLIYVVTVMNKDIVFHKLSFRFFLFFFKK